MARYIVVITDRIVYKVEESIITVIVIAAKEHYSSSVFF